MTNPTSKQSQSKLAALISITAILAGSINASQQAELSAGHLRILTTKDCQGNCSTCLSSDTKSCLSCQNTNFLFNHTCVTCDPHCQVDKCDDFIGCKKCNSGWEVRELKNGSLACEPISTYILDILIYYVVPALILVILIVVIACCCLLSRSDMSVYGKFEPFDKNAMEGQGNEPSGSYHRSLTGEDSSGAEEDLNERLVL